MLCYRLSVLRVVLLLGILALVGGPLVAQARNVLPRGSMTNAASKISGDSLSVTDMTVLTPQQVAQSLLGSNVTVSNVVFNGAPVSAGTFMGGSAAIGFEFGIILSSGDIASLPGPNTSDAISTDTGTVGDPELTNLAQNPTYNATSLDFDFQVVGASQISFQYVFSSDEFNEFVGTQYNDVFAFFLNGQNIALLPGGAPVAVNTVNCGYPYTPAGGTNCALYLNNRCADLPGGTFPCAGAFDTEMDGLTVVLTATGFVNAGTNHIRLIIADAGDAVYDSNVMIRAQSFIPGPAVPFFEPPSPCGNIVHAYVGQSFDYDVVAKAATGLPTNALTLSSGPLPAGAQHQPPLPLNASGPNATVTTKLVWTPQAADVGVHLIDYTAVDQLGQIASCRVTVRVEDPVVVSGQDYLLIGFSPLSIVIPDTNGRLLLTTGDWIVLPVTPETLPEWLIPPQAFGFHLYAQFGNFDPINYPADPIAMSNGLDIHIGVGWSSYGPTTMGIIASLEDPPMIFEEVSFEYEVER